MALEVSTDRQAPAAGAEFDAYSEQYTGGIEDPVKQLAGGSQHAFLALKARWVLRNLGRWPLTSAAHHAEMRLLDFGCGTGEVLQSLRMEGFTGRIEGCDISRGMLIEAARRWTAGPLPPLYLIGPGGTAFADGMYDLVTAACVFHHIAPAHRVDVFRELTRILKPGGRLIIFEHNPWNPLTRWIVSRAPIDRNAILLRAGEVREAMRAVGLDSIRTRYILFFPPRFAWAGRADALLSWLPFGGQYVVTGEKPPTSQ